MASRTYLIGLYAVLKTAHRYATRYQSTLTAHMTTEQATCLTSVIAALADCMVLLIPPEPPH